MANRIQRSQFVRFIKYRILHTDDSPHNIALGAALGFFIAWTPALGSHTILVLALSAILRANKLVAVACAWVSNPFTLVAIYYPNYLLGRAVLRFFGFHSRMSAASLMEMLGSLKQSAGLTGLLTAEFRRDFFTLLWHGAFELWLGGLLIGSVVAITGYFLTYQAVLEYRIRHPDRDYGPQQ